jgi:hypothetical protein
MALGFQCRDIYSDLFLDLGPLIFRDLIHRKKRCFTAARRFEARRLLRSTMFDPSGQETDNAGKR